MSGVRVCNVKGKDECVGVRFFSPLPTGLVINSNVCCLRLSCVLCKECVVGAVCVARCGVV